MNIPQADSDEEGKWIFVDNEFDYKNSIVFLKQVAASNLATIYHDMNYDTRQPKLFVHKDDKGQLTSEDLFTSRGFVRHGLCGLYNKRLGTYDNKHYKCPMLSNKFAKLNQQEFEYAMYSLNIKVGCDNKSMCKAYRIKHRLNINYYRNDKESGEDIINVIQSVKNFIQKI